MAEPVAVPPKQTVVAAKVAGEAMEIVGASVEDVTVQKLIRPENILEVRKKKPGMHYAWVRCKGSLAEQNVAQKTAMGYKPTKPGDVETNIPGTPGGTIVVGDLMLMEMPVSLAERHQKATMQKNVNTEKQADRMLKMELDKIKHPDDVTTDDVIIDKVRK